jgi:hypothetical protein
MAWSPQRPALHRRVVLVLDCLEDRTTPATFSLAGQTSGVLIPAAARNDLDASAVGRFAVAAFAPDVAAMINAARVDDSPFGFFDSFSQNGFGGDLLVEEAPLPQPRPVTPPLMPAQILPEPELPEIPMPIAPRVEIDFPPPPTLEVPWAPPMPASETAVVPHDQPQPQRVTEGPTPASESPDDAALVTSASHGSYKGVAAIGGLMAAFSLLYTSNIRERRYDDDLAFSHLGRVS